MSPPPVAVSVIVPARNAAATIGRTLAALAAQRLDEPFEVIVVDSGSSDETPELAARAPVVRALLRNPGGEPASSRNLGAGHARAAVLAFTDADCEPAPDWLAAGLAAVGSGLDLVQGRVVPAGPAGPFDRTVSVGSEYGLYETANLFVTRAAFDRVGGGFEPVPGIGLGPDDSPFGEDAWLAWRCKRAGARSGFARDAIVQHAVFPRGAAGFVAEQRRRRYFPALVAAIPELRGTLLRARVFLSADSLRFDLALAGALWAASRRRPAALVLVAPYVASLRGVPAAARTARVAADAISFGALIVGSVRARTLVL